MPSGQKFWWNSGQSGNDNLGGSPVDVDVEPHSRWVHRSALHAAALLLPSSVYQAPMKVQWPPGEYG